jgi:uncharacterized protein YndB with AHSA1/START domain
MENPKDLDKRILTLKRTFNAPRKLVWDAWTKSDHIVQWWAPKGMKTSVVEHDFRVGGKWKYVIPMPDGSEFISEGMYSEIVEPEKIVTSADFRPMTEAVVMQILLEENGNKTNFVFSIIHQTEEYCRQQEKMGFYNGWGTAFERLAGYVSGLVE